MSISAESSQIIEADLNWKFNTTIEGSEVFIHKQPVSIVFINGILNSAADIHKTGKEISDIYKGAKVICIGDPSQGLIRDLFQAACFAYSTSTFEIIDRTILTWKKALEQLDIKHPGKDGKIVHIAHSKGGLTTERALDRLVEISKTNSEYKEIISRLSIHIYGSPAHIKESRFDVQYYIQESSLGDPVPYLTPFRGSLHSKTDQTVRRLPSEGLVEHGILGKVYQEELRRSSKAVTTKERAAQSYGSTPGLRQRSSASKAG